MQKPLVLSFAGSNAAAWKRRIFGCTEDELPIHSPIFYRSHNEFLSQNAP